MKKLSRDMTSEELKAFKDFLMWNINVLREQPKFKKARNRNNNFTSCDELQWDVEVYENGYKYIANGVRTQAVQFVNSLGESIRKPRGIEMIEEMNFYNVYKV